MSDITAQDLDKFMDHIGVELLPWQRLVALRRLGIMGDKEKVFIAASSHEEAEVIARRQRLAPQGWRPLLSTHDASKLAGHYKPIVFATGCWMRHHPEYVVEAIGMWLHRTQAQVVDVACY